MIGGEGGTLRVGSVPSTTVTDTYSGDVVTVPLATGVEPDSSVRPTSHVSRNPEESKGVKTTCLTKTQVEGRLPYRKTTNIVLQVRRQEVNESLGGRRFKGVVINSRC